VADCGDPLLSGTAEFIADSALLQGAYAFAKAAHDGPRSTDETTFDHPLEVAKLLHEHGFEEPIVAAGLLHDVVEDTTVEPDEIREQFGGEVADLVTAMTEKGSIEPYELRKAEHRARASRDRSVAAIYAADKLATTRWLDDHGERPDPRQLTHYRATLDELCRTNPDLPFLGELRRELDELTQGR
jgi:(p)ppGpp synthase/HD superfamily hydrolase